MPLAFHTWGLNGAVLVAGGSVLFSIPITFYIRIRLGIFNLMQELVVLPMLAVGYIFGLLTNKAVSLFV